MLLLSDQTYLSEVEESINQAKKSIYVLMYSINLRFEGDDDPVYRLLNSLVRAQKERKVKVKVVLEDHVRKASLKAYTFLRKNNIDADFDTPLTFIHDKNIVIDQNISIIGSANWSRSALLSNSETSILIPSTILAKELIKKIDKIPLSKKSVLEEEKGVGLATSFLYDFKKGPLMVRNNAETGFDLYLLLLRENKISIPIEYEKWSNYLEFKRENFKDIANPMDKQYGLIKYLPDSRSITLISLAGSKKSNITIPDQYWDYGWDRKLSFPAKYLYLINLLETERSVAKPWWWRSQENMSKLYGISADTISKGMIELQRANLVEIRRSSYKDHLANYYSLNPLYSEDDLNQAFAKLKKNPNFSKAQKMADDLNEPNDIKVIETFIGLIDKYGYENVRRANVKTADLAIHNPKRNVENTVNILK